jgi:iron complex transport system ATP-binding protein
VTALLSVQDCTFRYEDGGFCLQRVALDVDAGEVVGIVGPNGSGKSTLLRLMGGLLKPHGGQVTLAGASIQSFARRSLARRLAFLPQDPETTFRFAVREVVAMGRYPYQRALGFLAAHDIEVVEQALAETDSAALGHRRFFTLSGGEKQRVLIAGVLAQEPSVMLLDEPTAALDIHHRSEILDLLWRLSRQDIAVVVVTHDLNAASQFCDRLVVLSQGEVARSGSPGRVMDEELLSAVYKADVRVVPNPVTATPMAIVPGKVAHELGDSAAEKADTRAAKIDPSRGALGAGNHTPATENGQPCRRPSDTAVLAASGP